MRLLLVTLALMASPALARTGGPDAFGYLYIDSNEPGGPAYAFEDISATGTLSSVTNSDDAQQWLAIGFNFPFYGVSYGSVSFQTNGAVGFSNASIGITNSCLPSAGALTPNFVAPMWDDLDPGGSTTTWGTYPGGDMQYELRGTPGVDQRLILQWTDVPDYGTNDTVTMQVVLFEDGVIHFAYQSLFFSTNSATIGIQNDSGLALQYDCNIAGSVTPGTLIAWLPPVAGPVDNDGDGFDSIASGGTDCNDLAATIYPGAVEACDGIDQNCDGYLADEYDLDFDGWRVCQGDCNDTNAGVNPGATDIPGNGIDEDCNGSDAAGGTAAATGASTGVGTGAATGSSTGAATGAATGTSTGAATGTSTGTSTGAATGTGTGGTGTGAGTTTGTATGTAAGAATGVGTGAGTGTGTGATAIPEYSKLGCGCASSTAHPAPLGLAIGLFGLIARRRRDDP